MKQSSHLYLIGAGGVGMQWIADYALGRGMRVSGVDLTESDGFKRLVARGATLTTSIDPKDIPEDVTEVVITSAITETAPHWNILCELKRRGVRIRKRAAWVGALTKKYTTIAVSGTHGKTTTTAMIGWILEAAGEDPTVFVGGTVAAWGATRVGSGKYLVLEADEYDRSFHKFYPQVAVVLNIEADHLDYYTKGIREIEGSFRRFFRNLPSGVHATPGGVGVVVAYGRDGSVRKALKGFKYKTRFYDEAHQYPGIKLRLPGAHMRLNASAAAKVCHELGVSHETILKALESFPGVGRRFEYLGIWGNAEMYDDYAHHPTEVRALLQSISERWKQAGGSRKKVAVVFQPHQVKRTAELLESFATCFSADAPDSLILAPIYEVAGREVSSTVSIATLGARVEKNLPSHCVLTVCEDVQSLEHAVTTATANHDVVFIVGAGSIRTLFETWRSQK